MDFKVTGTKDGVTAIQLDVKIEGLTIAMVEETLKKAEAGYLEVIRQMNEVISEPRTELSQYAPQLEMVQIDVDQIGSVIGPAGKNIKKITAETETEIDIDDEGRVYITATGNPEGVRKAVSIIRAMTTEIEVNAEYDGTVVRIMPFGAFVELVPGRDGFLHISNVAGRRIDKVEDVLDVGDVIPVKVREIDDQGKISLIRTDVEPAPPRDRGPRDGGGRGGGRDGGRGGRDGGRGGREGGRGGRDGGRGPRDGGFDRGGRDGGRDHAARDSRSSEAGSAGSDDRKRPTGGGDDTYIDEDRH
jgi:polyribonucleotide nucleotidyltransferase